MQVLFVHPDLGIGGAERLVVDAATQLQALGHTVHCFEETRDGTLSVEGYILFAMLRNLWLAACIFLSRSRPAVIFVDQLSVSIPLLRLTGSKILFYCHFPDKLLSKRDSFVKKLYRLPVDFVEEVTTAMADTIVVNSKFTQGVFQDSFRMIKSKPAILYPGIRTEAYDNPVDLDDESVKKLKSNKTMLISFNRFERKKNVELAVKAFAHLRESVKQFESLQLVVGGGYDSRVSENVEYHKELVQLAESLGLKSMTLRRDLAVEDKAAVSAANILFVLSFTESQRTYLLHHGICCLYTPSNEHFGIVPVEAMFARLPVIAVNSGGPTESIVDGVTGFLRPPTEEAFAEAIKKLLGPEAGPSMGRGAFRKKLGEAGRNRTLRTIAVGFSMLLSLSVGTAIAVFLYYAMKFLY
ncbi:alpha-1,3/1,6-mannosyltransferase ALG2-like protein [Zopfochytrium polystomum]|nr:alpha-1,3/1,6-mannosyltransferase ALG2-like protein [Zopfochytrium polystomum]